MMMMMIMIMIMTIIIITIIVLVVMGALGTIKDVENYSNKIPDNINIDELQKITLLSAAHLLRQVLSIK